MSKSQEPLKTRRVDESNLSRLKHPSFDVVWKLEEWGASGDEPRNFELRSSDEDKTPELAPPLLITTTYQREDVLALDIFNVHSCPTHGMFSGTGLEFMTQRSSVASGLEPSTRRLVATNPCVASSLRKPNGHGDEFMPSFA
ncbi:hypothetical protein TNCV_3737171 [Trichonephila clavipes]|nr:hypothetical protein TNCV_3737171 [Trichonephila clavipes]